MNGLSATILPPIMQVPSHLGDGSGRTFEMFNPPEFYLQEAVIAYWRVRQWRFTLEFQVTNVSFAEFQVGRGFTRQTMTGTFYSHTSGDAPDIGILPPSNEREIYAARVGGSFYKAIRRVGVELDGGIVKAHEEVYMDNPILGGDPVLVVSDSEIPGSIEVFDWFTAYTVKWNTNWPSSTFYPSFRFVKDGTITGADFIIAGGDYDSSDIGRGDIVGRWGTKTFSIHAIATGVPGVDLTGIRLDYATAKLEAIRYWPYADINGDRPKFDELTGEKIIYTD